MTSTRRVRSTVFWAAGLVIGGLLATPARAVVTEPNGKQVPIMVPQVEIDLAAGFNPPSVVSLSALFQVRGETIDWLKDAQTTPGVFSPVCGFSGELVLHGGACHIDFGWYNAVAGSKTPPLDSEIYTIIPGTNPPAGPPWMPWHPGVGEHGPIFTTDTIRADPRYKGGLIGFALRGDTGQDCKQTHFSEQSLNPVCSGGVCMTTPGSWAAAVIWQSTATPNAYYIGFEDLPMGPMSTGVNDFGSIAGQGLKCDGDFNDFVYFLSGLTCAGGGAPCDTGMPGVCGAGLNECVTGTTLKCRQSIVASAEVCDGLDNDCNGMTDDNAPCPGNKICDRGVCQPPCGTSEFACGAGDVCENAICVEAACAGKTCDAGKTCRAGACTGPCDGVTCPQGQVCHVGRCVDPCDGVTCEGDRVCEGGVCVPSCKCSGCGAGKSCDPSGHCLETACAGKTCAANEACSAGTCADRCVGATCPHGQQCLDGACSDIPKPDGGVGATPFPDGSPPGLSGGGGSIGTTGPGPGGAGTMGSHEKITPSSGCRCDAGPASGGLGWLVLLAFGALLLRRRSV